MKIFCLPSHQSKTRTSGVDFARIIQPMTHLNGHKGIETTIFDINKETDWLWVAAHFDAIYFNYLNNPWGYAAMGSMARKHGVKLIMDIDDDLWGLHDDNPAASVYKKGGEAINNFTSICNDVDYITCTSDYLKHVIMSNTSKTADKIKVFPNYIDLEKYSYKAPFKNTNQIVLTHFGSSTHFHDLNELEFVKGVDRIMKEYPNVSFRTIGAFVPKFKELWGMRYENLFGHVDIYEWIKGRFREYMEETDILLVPLVDDIYNKCKSDIKYLEASSAGIPGVYQGIRQYIETIEDGVDGFLAYKDTHWYKKIKLLIDDVELRGSMGEAAYDKVKDTRQIQDHLDEYADFFTGLLTDSKQ